MSDQETFMEDELYDDIMEAYAQGFVPCYGGGGSDIGCGADDDDNENMAQKESVRAAEITKASDINYDFPPGEFPEDIPF